MDKNLRHNYIVNLVDGGFFGIAMGFASFSAIIPLFMMTLTESAILIGMIPAIHSMGWQLPQLFMAKRTSKQALFKPLVVFLSIHERIPFLGLAVVALLAPHISKNLAIVLTLIMLIWQGLGGGIAGNGWQNLVAKIIPPTYLATFFGLQSSVMSLFSSIGSVFAGNLLAVTNQNNGFVICFTIAGISTIISLFFLNLTREEAHEVVVQEEHHLPLLELIKNTITKNRPFAWFILARILTQFGMMGVSFYIVYSVRRFDMSTTTAGIMTGILMFTQVIANIVLGWIADRWARKNVLIIGTVCAFLSAIMAAFVTNLNWFYIIFIFSGIAATTSWIIAMAFTMDFGQHNERPLYVGMANTIMAPSTILAPIIGGWIADTFGFQYTFITSAASALVASLIFLLFVHQNQPPTTQIA